MTLSSGSPLAVAASSSEALAAFILEAIPGLPSVDFREGGDNVGSC